MPEIKINKKQLLIMLTADEIAAGGEADYTLALADQLTMADGGNYPVRFFKVMQREVKPFAENKLHLNERSGLVKPPKNKADYANILPYHAHSIDLIGPEFDDIMILAVGQSTLPGLFDLRERLAAGRSDAGIKTGFITHTIHAAEDIARLVANDTTLFAPPGLKQSYLMGLDAVHAKQLRRIDIPSIPHTNTPESIALNYDALFTQYRFYNPDWRHTADTLDDWRARKQEFAVAVINAGYPVNGVHQPYTIEEAQQQGWALGQHLPPGTLLYALEGGPRNARDKTASGEEPSQAFIKAYCAANGVNIQDCLFDPFDSKNLNFNAVKVATAVANDPSCIAFISNAEGYSTMDGAIGTIISPRENFLMGFFPFVALQLDQSKRDNIDVYHARGFAKLSVKDDLSLNIGAPPPEAHTPLILPGAARQILAYYGAIQSQSPGAMTRIAPAPVFL
jgi:hypothetical protein